MFGVINRYDLSLRDFNVHYEPGRCLLRIGVCVDFRLRGIFFKMVEKVGLLRVKTI